MPKEKRKKNSSNNKERIPEGKRTRASLTGTQKQEVCLKKLQKPTPKNKELSKEFNVSEGMIYDILKNSKKWLALKSESYEASLKRQVKLNFSEIEEALSFWVE